MTEKYIDAVSNPLANTGVLITGGSSGIGEATARTLASWGANVVVVARRADRLQALITDLRHQELRAEQITADLTVSGAGERVVAAAVESLGRLDIVINNAGTMLLGRVQNAPLEEWQRMIEVNLEAALHVSRAALPHLLTAAKDSPRGVADLLMISSVAGRVARAGSAVYNATKHAIGAYSEALRQEVARQHVRVGVIEPGQVDTELRSHNRTNVRDKLATTAEDEPLTAVDIADIITFALTRPRHVALSETLVRPTTETG